MPQATSIFTFLKEMKYFQWNIKDKGGKKAHSSSICIPIYKSITKTFRNVGTQLLWYFIYRIWDTVTVILYLPNREHCYCDTLSTESVTQLLWYFIHRIGNTVTVTLYLANRILLPSSVLRLHFKRLYIPTLSKTLNRVTIKEEAINDKRHTRLFKTYRHRK